MRALAFLLLCACQRNDTGESPYCADTPTDLGLQEVTELGFAPSEILGLAEGTHEELFVWARDDSSTPLTLAVAHAGGTRFVHSEAVYPEGGEVEAIAPICEDRVELDVSVELLTGDGAFDEAFAAVLAATAVEQGSLFAELDPDALGGSYDLDAEITEPDYEDKRLFVDIAFDAEGSHGEIAGQISGEEACDGNDCTAWAAEIEVGAWGAEQP